MTTDKIKYDLTLMLAEIEEDEKVFEHKPDLWASQEDIERMVRERRRTKEKKS